MPVLLKTENMLPQVSVDLDKLVTDLRERLCIKNKERNCSRRSSPYQNRRHDKCNNVCCEARHNTTSPNGKDFLHKCHHRSKVSKLKCVSDDPRALLDKLLRDQSLIQEAVRRVQFQFNRKEVPSNALSVSDFSSNHLLEKFVSSSDNEECTGYFNHSESSDASQHSVN